MISKKIHIVGGGLAGVEAAWQILRAGFQVVLHEMRPVKTTPAHTTDLFAELVCSNSLKSSSLSSASGELKAEMRRLGSLVLSAADNTSIPAGEALAVDRILFSKSITNQLLSHPNFVKITEEISNIPPPFELEKEDTCWIISTGPLTSDAFALDLQRLCGSNKQLYFYDAVAPVIAAESINYNKCFRASRYNETSQDYLNIPLNKEEYETLVKEVLTAEKVELRPFEEPKYFEACLPLEVMIERGPETLRFGPLRPVGLIDPITGKRPWANVQLRQEDKFATMYSIVGFQTKMKWPEQKRTLSLIPGLERAEFLRYGSIHRNTYLHSPSILNFDMSFKTAPRIFLAGQITGVEGYMESAAMGILAGRFAIAKLLDKKIPPPPTNTMIGALLNYVLKGLKGEFTPMNANMGILSMDDTRLVKLGRKEKHERICNIARESFEKYASSIEEKSY